MNKFMVFPGAIPLDTNILQPQRASEIALGFIMQAAFGTGTVIDGLAVTQTVSPSMGVLVGPGAIIVSTTVDTVVSGFGSLPVDSNPLVKIGINLTPTTLTTLTAPGTAGQSQNTLVEAQFLEADGTPVVLPYYNSANPSIPFTGPSNAGTPNNTVRANTVQLQYKQGTAAATGSQSTPAPDAGWTGVAVITIANGQSSVLNANITPYVNAPVVSTKLPALRIKLTSNLTLFVSPTGSDLSSGLSASVPFATIQKAWNTVVNGYDLNGFTVTIQLANGTYTTGLNALGSIVGGYGPQSVVLQGNVGSPSSVTISSTNSSCIVAQSFGGLTVQGVTFVSGGSGSVVSSINVGSTSQVNFASVVFGSSVSSHIVVGFGGQVVATGNYSISGSAPAHLFCSSCGSIFITAGLTVTLTGTPAFATAFAVATSAGVISTSTTTYSGSATGSRYAATVEGIISTGGGGANYFPGNSAGTAPTGIYV